MLSYLYCFILSMLHFHSWGSSPLFWSVSFEIFVDYYSFLKIMKFLFCQLSIKWCILFHSWTMVCLKSRRLGKFMSRPKSRYRTIICTRSDSICKTFIKMKCFADHNGLHRSFFCVINSWCWDILVSFIHWIAISIILREFTTLFRSNFFGSVSPRS